MVLLLDMIKSMIVPFNIYQKCISENREFDEILIKYEGKKESPNSLLDENIWLFRYLKKDYIELLNRDADSYCYNAPLDVLEDAHEIFSYLYSNSDGAGISDHVFDTVEYYIKKKYKVLKKSFEKIGSKPLKKLRVSLPFPMGSLEKIKPGQKRFEEYVINTKKIFISEKLDGVSALWYGGKLYSRGDGVEGGDISYLVDYIQGLYPSQDAIRGELVIKKSIFEEKWSRDSNNPRSFVSGKSNLSSLSPKDIERIRDIEFVAYEVVTSDLSPQSQFSTLESMGFRTPRHEILQEPTSFTIVDLYRKYRKESLFAIDGLVLQKASISSKKTAVAFKMLLEEQTRMTKINNIDWRISRHGRYVPVALYDTIYIDGNRYHKALAFNASWVRDKSLGYGTKVKIARSGDVIPQIVDVEIDSDIQPIFPSTKYYWKWEGKDIILDDIEGNRDVKIARLLYFFETLNIPRLGAATLTKFFDGGLDTISKITRAKIEDFSKIKGVGKKLGENFYVTIKSSLSSIRLDRLMICSGIFKGLGAKLLRAVYLHYPEVLFESVDHKKLNSIEGYGQKRAEAFVKYLKNFRDFAEEILGNNFENAYRDNLAMRKLYRKDEYYPIFSGKNIVFTGFLGDIPMDIEDFIYDHDCKVGTKIDDKTICVIANSISAVSEKTKTAISKKIPVYTKNEFYIKYRIRKEEKETLE